MHIPHLAHVALCQEGPAVLDKKWAAVGHLNVTHIFSVIQDAAKIQGHGLDMKIRKVDFSPNGNLLLMRMLKKLYCQSLLYHPDIQILFMSRVKSDGEMKFLPYLQLHRLQGDEKH